MSFSSSDVALISTFHDPESIYVPFIEKHAKLLSKLYAKIEIIATPLSSARSIQTLEAHGFGLHLKGSKEIGTSRREAIQAGLVHPEIKHFHYCDFDRILFWLMHEAEELGQVISQLIPQADYTALGRTDVAFATHPAIQIETEKISNGVFSQVVGREMDVTAGSCGMSRKAAELIFAHSTEPTNATDTEWPMLIQFRSNGQLSLGYFAAEGLAFETPTFHGEAVNESLINRNNYMQRVVLARESVEAVYRVLREAEA